MGCRGLLISVTDQEVADLVAKSTHEDRVGHVINELEEVHFGSERTCETDKAWDAIHRAFEGSSELNFDASTPLKLVVLGGEPMHSEDGYIIVLKRPHEVSAASVALEAVDESAFRQRYFAIDPGKYGQAVDEEDFTYSWGWLQEAKTFYKRAAEAGRSVLFTVDQ